MRYLLPLLLVLGFTFGGCHCGNPANPTPVTLRIKNTSNDPIYVNVNGGQLGMEIQRQSFGNWTTFTEELDCPCQACDVICRGGCECNPPPQQALVQKIPAGTNKERTWGGVAQTQGVASCGNLVGGADCLRADIPPVDETLRIHFCYGTSAPGLPDSDGGTPVPGTLTEESLLCVNREFHIADGVVEVSPAQGAACTSHADCAGDGGTALCFSGACTTACPANDFPTLGASWQVSVADITSDNGFFTFNTTPDGKSVYTGTGTVGSASYSSNTTTLYVQRPSGGVRPYTASVQITMPPGYAVPFNANEPVSVTVIDASTDANPNNRAIVIRDGAGKLLLAADPAQLKAVLTATDTAPFTVSATGDIVGCEFNGTCGKRLFYSTRFEGGDTPVELNPGKSASVVAAGATYKPLNVGNFGYKNTSCSLKSAMPYVILIDRTAP